MPASVGGLQLGIGHAGAQLHDAARIGPQPLDRIRRDAIVFDIGAGRYHDVARGSDALLQQAVFLQARIGLVGSSEWPRPEARGVIDMMVTVAGA